jgi:hypothetical protein
VSDFDEVVIQFYNMYGAPNGAVSLLSDGTLHGSDENRQHFADDWIKSGGTGQSFVERFANWGNGYAASRRIYPDFIEPPAEVADQGPLR